MNHPHIIKRGGHTEPYDNHKVYTSVHRACRNSHLEEKMCSAIAERVRESVNIWIKDRDKTSSQELFEKIANEIRVHDNDAAFLYATHRDIS